MVDDLPSDWGTEFLSLTAARGWWEDGLLGVFRLALFVKGGEPRF